MGKRCSGRCAGCDECLYIGGGDYWCADGRGIVGEGFAIYGPQRKEAKGLSHTTGEAPSKERSPKR